MQNLTNKNFKETIDSNTPVVVDFWADWCGPCKMLTPIFEEASKEMNNLNFAKLNTEDYGDIAAEHSVMSIPTLIVFKENKEIGRLVGGMSKEDLKSKLTEIIS
jgi:thioredoxin